MRCGVGADEVEELGKEDDSRRRDKDEVQVRRPVVGNGNVEVAVERHMVHHRVHHPELVSSASNSNSSSQHSVPG